MGEHTRESIVQAAKAAALRADGPLSLSEFRRASGISEYFIYRLFPDGGWSEIRQLAQIERHPKDKDSLSDEALLAELHRVATEFGKIPSWHKFAALSQVSPGTLKKRFSGRAGSLKAYREWLERNAPDSPILASFGETAVRESHRPPSTTPESARPSNWTKLDGIEYGAPINFRGLRHAPINEQGVVYLFGIVSHELGLIVEAVQAGYPDCEAKRCVNAKDNRWQRVRIEFEFRSRNFVDHGHNPAGADLIVCWEHNWPECPLEVIELRTVIERLEG
ncbi:MAG: homing endonuclease associated repeat-containing protein [Pirellulales bacterium]